MVDIFREVERVKASVPPSVQIELEELCNQLKDAIQFNYGTIERRTTAKLRNILERNGVRLPRGKTQEEHDHLWD